MISLDAARAILLADVQPLGVEDIDLDEADGRILADDLIAAFDQPREARSAMDGYAMRAGDAVAGATLRLVGTAFAGEGFTGALDRGSAVRIATGGVVPDGADRVVMQESCERDGDAVRITGSIGTASFIRPAGGDFLRGDGLIPAGTRLGPAHLGLVAANGMARVTVRQRPRVTIFASGDELREPGTPSGPGTTFNSAAYAVAALVRRWGGLPRLGAILPDDHDRVVAIVAAAMADTDVLLFIGGASVGDRDVLRSVVQGIGGDIRFDRVAVQPGKPSWHARFANGPLVLGLPGNPVSALVCAHLLLEPLLAALTGVDSVLKPVTATLTESLAATGPRETYWRARAFLADHGRIMVAPDPRTDSSLQQALVAANALIRRPANAPSLATGEAVDVIFLAGGVALA